MIKISFYMALFLYNACQAFAVPSLELKPNFNTIGIEIKLDSPGQANGASAKFRIGNSGPFIDAHPLSQVNGLDSSILAGSLLWLSPGTEYEVEVTLEGGSLDGSKLDGSTFTRSEDELIAPSGLAEIYVAPGGREDPGGCGQCTETMPCDIEYALGNCADAGNEVLILPGEYYAGSFILDDSDSSAAQPIVVRGVRDDAGEVPKIDGRDFITSSWQSVNGYPGVYQTTYDRFAIDQESLVIYKGDRLYPFASLEELSGFQISSENSHIGTPIDMENISGFFAEGDILYVHLADDVQPDNLNHKISVSEYFYCFRVRTGHVFLLDLRIQYFGADRRGKAIRLDPTAEHNVGDNSNTAHDVTISDCELYYNDVGVDVGLTSYRNVIQRTSFVEGVVSQWPWDSIKSGPSELEGGGVFFSSPDSGDYVAENNVVRYNRFHGYFDGADFCPYRPVSSGYNEISSTQETDIHDNKFYDMGDDGFQLDGFCSNVRVWRNEMYNSFTGISLAPVYGGPVFVVKNLIHSLTPRAIEGDVIQAGAPVKFKADDCDPGVVPDCEEMEKSGDMFLYHNTIAAFESCPARKCYNGLAISQKDGDVGWTAIFGRNNIWYGRERAISKVSESGFPVDIDYDNLHNDEYNQLIYWEGEEYAKEELAHFQTVSGQETNGIAENPEFNAPSDPNRHDRDFTLAQTSELIDAGVAIPGINDDHEGLAPDIGAFEFYDECPNDPARIHSTGYPSLQSACDAASSGNTIQVRAVEVSGIDYANSAPVFLQGGYDCDFFNNRGFSKIGGTMTITSGSVTVEKIEICKPAQ